MTGVTALQICQVTLLGQTFLPVVYMCDCWRSVAKDPGLDVHWFCFGVGYGHVYNPLQASSFVACHREEEKKKQICEVRG